MNVQNSLHLMMVPSFSRYQILVNILEIGILLVGQVIESRRIELISRAIASITKGCSLLLLALVLPLEGVTQYEEQCKLYAVGYQDRSNSKLVGRSLLSAVEEGTGDIAYART